MFHFDLKFGSYELYSLNSKKSSIYYSDNQQAKRLYMNSLLKSFRFVVVSIALFYGFAWCSINKSSVQGVSKMVKQSIEAVKSLVGQDSISLATIAEVEQKEEARKDSIRFAIVKKKEAKRDSIIKQRLFEEEQKEKERQRQDSIEEANKQEAERIAAIAAKKEAKRRYREKELADWKKFSQHILKQMPRSYQCGSYLEDCLANVLTYQIKKLMYSVFMNSNGERYYQTYGDIKVKWNDDYNIEIIIPDKYYKKARKTSGITKDFPKPPHPYNVYGLRKLKAALKGEKPTPKKRKVEINWDAM